MICPGVAPAIPTPSWFLKSCFNRLRSPPFCLIIMHGCAASPLSLRWLARANHLCSAPGRALVITRGRATFIAAQKRSSKGLLENYPLIAINWNCCLVLVDTPLMPLLYSPSTNRCRWSKPIVRGFSREFAMCASRSIPRPPGENCGTLPRGLFRKTMRAISKTRSLTSERSFADPAIHAARLVQ